MSNSFTFQYEPNVTRTWPLASSGARFAWPIGATSRLPDSSAADSAGPLVTCTQFTLSPRRLSAPLDWAMLLGRLWMDGAHPTVSVVVPPVAVAAPAVPVLVLLPPLLQAAMARATAANRGMALRTGVLRNDFNGAS